jgi:hypothetical protein
MRIFFSSSSEEIPVRSLASDWRTFVADIHSDEKKRERSSFRIAVPSVCISKDILRKFRSLSII